MNRYLILLGSLCFMLQPTWAVDGLCGPASTQRSERPAQRYASIDFSGWPLEGWRDVREERFPGLGQWTPVGEGITNLIPEGADEKALVAMKGGLGMASSVLEGDMARNLTAIAQMAFERKGAPSVLLRAQVDGALTGEVLSLVLYEKGVNLWRYDGAKWHKAAAATFPVQAGIYHRVKVRLAGPAATVWVDGKQVAHAADIGLDAPGAIGLWAGEGPCYFKSLRIRYEDLELTAASHK